MQQRAMAAKTNTEIILNTTEQVGDEAESQEVQAAFIVASYTQGKVAMDCKIQLEACYQLLREIGFHARQKNKSLHSGENPVTNQIPDDEPQQILEQE